MVPACSFPALLASRLLYPPPRYHPDDTMVPRDWWSGGLLADLKYYSPFGLMSGEEGRKAAVAGTPAAA